MQDTDPGRPRTYRLQLPDAKKLAIFALGTVEVTYLLVGGDYQTTFTIIALVCLLILGLYSAHLSDVEKQRQFVRDYGTSDPTAVVRHDPAERPPNSADRDRE
jgi:hypothetical protein